MKNGAPRCLDRDYFHFEIILQDFVHQILMPARRFRMIAVAGWKMKVRCTPWSNLRVSRRCVFERAMSLRAVKETRSNAGKKGEEEVGIQGKQGRQEGINGRDGEAEDDGLWRRTKESVGATEKARVLQNRERGTRWARVGGEIMVAAKLLHIV